MRAITLLLAMMSLSILTSCGNKVEDKDDEISKAEYNELVNKYNKQINKHNSIVKQNLASDLYLISTNELLSELDEKALDVRSQTKSIRENIGSYTSRTGIKEDMKVLDLKIQDALSVVSKLEKQTSKKNMDQVILNTDTIVKSEYRGSQKELARSSANAVSSLSGIRDLLLSQYNDLVSILNARLAELPEGTEPSDLDTRNEGNNPDVNPIVTNYNDGGKVIGIARDSVSGDPIIEAFVGFKRRRESTDYFYTTNTDSDGNYSSPHLLPGTYYVDITREGYINITDQTVRVNRGQDSNENISLSEPLENSVFRVTMSWSTQKPGAVRDVDSYLSIPGVSIPNSYNNKGRNYHGTYLDRDDTDWIGPETVTIHELKQGTYTYYVNNYSERGNISALGNSEVRVKLYKGENLLQSFQVPAGSGLNYELFKIVDGEVKVTGKYNSSLDMH